MEVVGADHRDLGIILPGRAESDRKAGLQGDTDLDEHNESVQTIEGRVWLFLSWHRPGATRISHQLGGAGLAPQVVKTGLAEEEDSAY